jgi:hypothetical protein
MPEVLIPGDRDWGARAAPPAWEGGLPAATAMSQPLPGFGVRGRGRGGLGGSSRAG